MENSEEKKMGRKLPRTTDDTFERCHLKTRMLSLLERQFLYLSHNPSLTHPPGGVMMNKDLLCIIISKKMTTASEHNKQLLLTFFHTIVIQNYY
jgi:hypothetical protein